MLALETPPLLDPAVSIRPTTAIIDLRALVRNLDFIRRQVGPRCGIMAVVKADAYGHGMIPVARACMRWGVQALAVGTADEALTLRDTAGFEGMPILVMGPTQPDDAPQLQRAGVSVAAGCIEVLRANLKHARTRGASASIHLKLDTGMGRYGFKPDDKSWLELVAEHQRHIDGLFTHFAVSDSLDAEHRAFTNRQREAFEFVVRVVFQLGARPVYHAANSGAILHHPQSYFEMVRPGILMYGSEPDPWAMVGAPLHPVLRLQSRLLSVHQHRAGETISYGRTFTMPRDGRIGIVPIGYGDGYPRALSNRAEVLVQGRRARVAGRVCMDQLMIDLTDIPEAQVGDEVVLYGAQGSERISLEEVAALANAIPYELTCALSRRVPRVYLEPAQPRPRAPRIESPEAATVG